MLSSSGRNDESTFRSGRSRAPSTLLKSDGALIVGRAVNFFLRVRLARFEVLDAMLLLPSTAHEAKVEDRRGGAGLGRSS